LTFGPKWERAQYHSNIPGGLDHDIDGLDRNIGLDHDIGGLDHDIGGLDRNIGLDHDIGVLDHDIGGLDHDIGGLDRDTGGLDRDIGGLDRDIGGLQHIPCLGEYKRMVTYSYIVGSHDIVVDCWRYQVWSSLLYSCNR